MTDTAPRIIGSLREEDGSGTVHLEDLYPTTIDDLWNAITDPERLARWVVTVDGDLSVGGEFTAKFTSGWDGIGRVDVCEAPRHLIVTTREKEDSTPEESNGASDAVVEAWLTAEGDSTRLVVEERGLPVGDIPYHGSGWQTHFEDLGSLIAGREPGPWEPRWKELTPIYLAMPVTR